MNRLLTDALREISRSKGRFLAVFLLTMLAVGFLVGLRSTAPDMQNTADKYFDDQNLMDVRVLCNLGITPADIQAISKLDDVEDVEPCYSLDAISGEVTVKLYSMPDRMNKPVLLEGRMPESDDECVTEQKLLDSLGASIGDTITVDAQDNNDSLTRKTFKVVGIVKSPLYISFARGSSSIGTGNVTAYVYLPKSAFHMDYYTMAYIKLDGSTAMQCYGSEYKDYVSNFIDGIDDFANSRAQTRHDELVGDATADLDAAQKEFDDAKADVEKQLADARDKLQSSREQLDQGWSDLESGKQELADQTASAQAQLDDSYNTLVASQDEYDSGLAAYNDGVAQLDSKQADLDSALAALQAQASKESLEQQKTTLEGQKSGLEQQIASLQSTQTTLETTVSSLSGIIAAHDAGQMSDADYETSLAAFGLTPATAQAGLATFQQNLSDTESGITQAQAGLDQINAGLAQVQQGLDGYAAIEAGQAQIDAARETLAATKTQLDDAAAQLQSGWDQYYAGVQELADSTASAEETLAESQQSLEEGETQYEQGVTDYNTGKEEADSTLADNQTKLDDAKQEIDDIEDGEWYVLDRDANMGYLNFSSDADRMSNLANVFPLIFFLVAALSALTSMTRMVEEKRTEIGCLKALGFGKWAISIKYLGYAAFGSITGGFVGAFIGATGLPAIIYNAWGIVYSTPNLIYSFSPSLFAFAIGMGALASVGAALWACLATLLATPADLMRPKAPKAGKRVLLERVKPIWNHLSFIWKVTVRNLFRYKRRFWMTVIGIGGCTALVITGFGLHDSIFDMMSKQFDEVAVYDASAELSDKLTSDELSAITAYLDSQDTIEGYSTDYYSSTELSSATGKIDSYVNLLAFSDDNYQSYVSLHHPSDGSPITLPDEGVVLDQKGAELLGVGIGDTITVKNADGAYADMVVQDIAENYIYHYAYMSMAAYTKAFGSTPLDNDVFINYTENTTDVSDAVASGLMKLDGVTSYSRINDTRDVFTDSMNSINYAVMIIIFSAAALTFIVLFNLTNINVTERRRELATLKVLGFNDRETSSYIYRENIILTLIGILLGLVMGTYLHMWLMGTVEIDMLMFWRGLHTSSYLWGIGLTLLFSLLVNIVAGFSLRKIDMVESLKSVE